MVGSYLNVVIHRLPRGLSTVTPGSACPGCRTPIAPLDNVPLVSYLLLGGRCRHCERPIGWRYPAVEAATGLLFLASFLRFGATPSTLIACLLCAILVALAVIDAEHYLLPNRITYPGIAAGLLLSPLAEWTTLRASLLGALAGGAGLIALIGLWYLIRRQLAMGFGDPKMLAMLGAFLGLRQVVLVLFLASLFGSLVGVVLVAAKRADMQSRLPFGVYLAVAGLVALFAGSTVIDAYLGLF